MLPHLRISTDEDKATLFNEYFVYDEVTGLLHWRKSPARCIQIGDVASRFHKHKGCMVVTLKGVQYKVHRVIWAMMRGACPPIIDHIDRDATNNRLENLRAADVYLNAANASVHQDKGSGLPRGMDIRGNRYRVKINNTAHNIKVEKLFKTYEEAEAFRVETYRSMGLEL